MITVEQNRANLRSAERIVAIALNIDNQGGTWRTALSYEQRVAYDKALADYIVAHPAAFMDQTVQTAKLVASQNLTPLADTGFDLDLFVSATVDNAVQIGDSVADIGRGAAAAASSLRWLIPAVLVIAVGIALWKWTKAVPAP